MPTGAQISQSEKNASAGAVRVTWSDIARLVDAHPSVAASKYRRVAARAAIDAAGAIPNPSVEATAAYGQANDDATSKFEWGLALEIPFDWIAKRGARVAVADADAIATEAESRQLRRRVLLQLRLLFLQLVYAQERVSALDALERETATLAQTVRRRVEKGESRPVVATRVEIEAQKVAGALASARSALSVRQAQLAVWLHNGGNQRITAVADLTQLPSVSSAAEARDMAQKTNPVVQAARARNRALAANITLARRQRMPSMAMRGFADHELDRTAYGITVSVDIPLWNWNSGNIERAVASQEVARSQLQTAQLRLEAEVIAAQGACASKVALAQRYRDEIHPRAVSAAQSIERAYQLGEVALLDVIDARRTLIDTRTQLLKAYLDAQLACTRLTILTGESSHE